ncbi:hypothetical protein GLOIN_2v1772162 [Rhizophagus clarus]|uniref:Uncharacterized protein n=1 Tax=Rhizophagus clarus TaxID=94130 RepID=A0A8H3MIM3_9GLOM|nr:hypothetical protein GLOIN_2v1772162 [Rhizophagus clarus]
MYPETLKTFSNFFLTNLFNLPEISLKLKLWKVDIDIDEISIGEELFKDEMKPQKLFQRYFKTDETDLKRKMVSDLDEENIVKKEKLVATTSISMASMIRFLTEGEENKKWIKADFTKPNKLCDNTVCFKREVSYLKAEDIDLANGYLKKHPHHKDNNGEMVIEIINIIRNSTSICITYNGTSFYDKNYTDSDIQKGLVFKFYKHLDSLDAYAAIKSIIHHLGKPVLLYVNETMRLYAKESIVPLDNLKIMLN